MYSPGPPGGRSCLAVLTITFFFTQMGATDIHVTGTGLSMSKAFDALQEEARQENGNDSYNGTISTIGTYTDHTQKFATSGKKLDDYLEEILEDIDKWEAIGICVTPPKDAEPGEYVFVGWAAC
jgi:hypothetical protein